MANSTKASVPTSTILLPISEDFGEAVEKKEVWQCCRRKIASATQIDSAQLHSKVLEGSTTGCEALFSKNSDDMSLLEGKIQTPLVKWFRCAEVQYWVGFRISFAGNRKTYVRTVSLMVARSFPGAGTEALLRAEWDYWALETDQENRITEHAQPHWHIYSARIDAENNDTELAYLLDEEEDFSVPTRDFSPEDDRDSLPVSVDDKTPKNSLSIENFHFAMCAHWTRNHNIVKWPIRKVELEHWVECCLAYIRSELETKAKNSHLVDF